MAYLIGPTTDPSTATKRSDVGGSDPASFRYCNPGAQYPSAEAARFGQIGYGMIGGGHLIARFPSPVNGAAANFDLLFRRYVNISIGEAGKRWTGANGFGVPGYDPSKILTRDTIQNAESAIAFLRAIAGRESGRGSNLTSFQWRQAHDMFSAGSADDYLALAAKAPADAGEPDDGTGGMLVALARRHVGEEYRNVQVPKDDANWTGPWDCAEFVTWAVYQTTGKLFGCLDDGAKPANADAYTGAWRADLESGKLTPISVEKASGTPGAILLRYPPAPGQMGHIAISDGAGGTVEAKGRRYGVVEDTVQGRSWDTGLLVPGISYEDRASIPVRRPADIYRLSEPGMEPAIVAAIERALASKGYFAGGADGIFDEATRDAVTAFQTDEGLVVDGEVGPETADALGISLVAEPLPQAARPDATDPMQDHTLADLVKALKAILSPTSASGATQMSTTQPALTSVLEQVAEILKVFRPQSDGQADAQGAGQDRQFAQLKEIIALLLPVLGVPSAADPGTPSQQAATDQGISSKPVPLGQVNGALGQSIGSLLDGKKTAIGLIGSLVTQLLSAAPPQGAETALGRLLAVAPGTSQFAQPVFLAISAWGILGKFEKWAQGSAPLSSGTPKSG